MADDIAITAGAGTSVAADDCTTGYVQLVKLAYGADGNRTHVAADADGLLVNLGANNDVTVSGVSTAANQTTIIGHVDGIETVLGTIDADTSALAGTVAGTELQVDIVAALPAGTNNIGDVDVLSVVPGTGATALGKAIDTAAGATDTGVAVLAVRDDALAALTPIEGDYVPLRTDANGALWVIPSGTSAVSGTVTANLSATDNAVLDAIEADTTTIAGAVSGTEMQCDVLTLPALPAGTNNIGDVDILTIAAGDNNIGNVDIVTMPNVTLAAGTNTNEVVGDVAHDSPAAGNPVLVGGYASAAAPTSVSLDGDAVRAWMLLNGAQATVLTAAGALIGGDAANGLDCDITRLPALVAGTANIGDVDVLTVPAPLSTTGGGTEATALRVTIASDSTGVLSIDDNGGTITVDGTVTVGSLPASTNTLEVVGDVAHSIAVSGNPIVTAGAAQNTDDTAPPNRVDAEGDATRIATSWDGAVFALPHGPQIWSYHVDGSSALTDTTVHASPGAGLSLYVTDIVISSGAATAMNVFFEEGASKVLGPYYLEAVAGRGLHIRFGTPKKVTAATALTVTSSAAIAHSIDVTGYTAPG